MKAPRLERTGTANQLAVRRAARSSRRHFRTVVDGFIRLAADGRAGWSLDVPDYTPVRSGGNSRPSPRAST
jgi:hypothetical protein